MNDIHMNRYPIKSGMTSNVKSEMHFCHFDRAKRVESSTKSLECHRKKSLLLIIVIAGLTGNLLTACTAHFEDLNTNPNQVTADQMEVKNYRTGTKVLNLQNLVIPIQEHMYQFNESLSGGPFGGYIGSTVDTWLTRFETFNPSADWRKWPFANVMTETYAPYRGIVTATDDELAKAYADLLRVAIMHRVTDSYGPIPYSDAVANESIYVKYDSQEQVYMKMFEELDAAIEVFSDNAGLVATSWATYDYVYYGNMGQWAKYANSLKLRMAMRLSYVEPELAKAKAAEAIAGGVIRYNADNAYMHPVENRMTLIYNDWADHRVGADIVNYMNGYKDPRREKMLLPNEDGVYAGIRIGSDISSKTAAVAKYSNLVVESDTPVLWLNAAEVSFLMAEYELRWGSETSARQYYEEGIRLSFEEKGASGADKYIADAESTPETYRDLLGGYSVDKKQSDITIAWESEGEFDRNLERIITQKWIAIFPLGVEAWSEYRRTGYPRLLPAPQDKSGGTVDLEHHARRLTYPVEEYQMNNANLQEAIAILDSESQGDRSGDIMGTRLWWDCKQ